MDDIPPNDSESCFDRTCPFGRTNTFTPSIILTALAADSIEKLARRSGLQPGTQLALKMDTSSPTMLPSHPASTSQRENWDASFNQKSRGHLAPRSYDYDVCSANMPTEDFRVKSNSLAEVCHFVANIKPLFVSLSSTAAAYLPSWISYITTPIISFVQLIISLRSQSLNDEEKLGWKQKSRNVGACIVAVFRTTWIAIKIGQHRIRLPSCPLFLRCFGLTGLLLQSSCGNGFLCWDGLGLVSLYRFGVSVYGWSSATQPLVMKQNNTKS